MKATYTNLEMKHELADLPKSLQSICGQHFPKILNCNYIRYQVVEVNRFASTHMNVLFQRFSNLMNKIFDNKHCIAAPFA